ncbi:hypothetical protein [Desulforamulus aeronauticus]|uniref:Uncharacterized protein n=1 Tax=Desulforamulus aeronauticus DSM 10349 TaxID=1121421 RepID=A0A1M6UQE3_9FIRM|nr:hypothetical protein [Desulforamulus aeronauticus]SHK71356.1 hypothetical protein SAMN02745123_02875 [Desulforamulus aeronauticus DSM 10349]
MENHIKINGIVLDYKQNKQGTKRKIIWLLLCLLMLWSIISLYFYRQHLLVVKSIPLNENIQVGDTKVYLRELSLVNFERKPFDYDHLPWYAEFSKQLPPFLIMPFYKTITFYSSPYTFDDNHGKAAINGYYLSPVLSLEDRIFPETVDIWLAGAYEVGYLGGTSTNHSANSNLHSFQVYGEHVPLDVKELYIMVNDKVNNKNHKIPIKLDWETKTYTFFNPFPVYWQTSNPLVKVQEFIKLNEKDKNPKLAQLILHDKLKTFPWQHTKHEYWQLAFEDRVSYQATYQGQHDVITVTLTFGENKENSFKGIAEQTFYLIDHQGSWKIIDVHPVRKI